MFHIIYMLVLGFLWTLISLQLFHLTCLTFFKPGPYTKETWNKHWFKRSTIFYWKMVARKHKGKLVLLQDFENAVYISVGKPAEGMEDIMLSYVFFTNKIGSIELQEDGRVTRDGDRYYIYNWLPFDTEERTWMVLQHDAKNFDLVVA